MPFCSSSADFKHMSYMDGTGKASEITSIRSLLGQLGQAEFFLPLNDCVLQTLLWDQACRANLITFLLPIPPGNCFNWPRLSDPVLPAAGNTTSTKDSPPPLSYATVLFLSWRLFLLKLPTRLTVSFQPAVLVSASQLGTPERTAMSTWPFWEATKVQWWNDVAGVKEDNTRY